LNGLKIRSTQNQTKLIFNKLFKRSKKLSEPISLSVLKVDFHSHLIPGIDDGAQDMDEAISLIREMKDLGFTKLITTPHVMSDFFKNTPEIIQSGLEELQAKLKECNIEIETEAAAEYYIDDGFVSKLENEKLLTFGDGHVLFEVSYINCPDNINDIIFRMMVAGYKPVMAHPERYPYWYRDIDMYRKFKDQGVILQININSLTGYYGPEAKKIAEKLIDENLVGAVGSDLHHSRHLAALKDVRYELYFQKISETNLLNKFL